jgi:hypothetical protein
MLALLLTILDHLLFQQKLKIVLFKRASFELINTLNWLSKHSASQRIQQASQDLSDVEADCNLQGNASPSNAHNSSQMD